MPKKNNMQVQEVGTQMFGVKRIRILVKIFFFYQKMDSTPLRQTSGKWRLDERYGVSNFGEKGFQLFEHFIDRLELHAC